MSKYQQDQDSLSEIARPDCTFLQSLLKLSTQDLFENDDFCIAFFPLSQIKKSKLKCNENLPILLYLCDVALQIGHFLQEFYVVVTIIQSNKLFKKSPTRHQNRNYARQFHCLKINLKILQVSNVQ